MVTIADQDSYVRVRITQFALVKSAALHGQTQVPPTVGLSIKNVAQFNLLAPSSSGRKTLVIYYM